MILPDTNEMKSFFFFFYMIFIGQITQYMYDLGKKYAFITTYDDTVFLRQTIHERKWTLEYSPAIKHIQRCNVQTRSATLRQCFLYIALLAQQDSEFDKTGMRTQSWVTLMGENKQPIYCIFSIGAINHNENPSIRKY